MARWKEKCEKKPCNRCSYLSVCLASTKMCSRGHHRWHRKEDDSFEAVKFNTMVLIILDKTSMIGNKTLSDLFTLKDSLLPKSSLKIVSCYKHTLLSGYFCRKIYYEIVWAIWCQFQSLSVTAEVEPVWIKTCCYILHNKRTIQKKNVHLSWCQDFKFLVTDSHT